MTRRLISTGSPFEKTAGYSRAVVDGDWCFVAGTTGYDVLNQLDGILVDRALKPRIEKFYEWATEVDEPYGFQFRAAKAEILKSVEAFENGK